jgi:hypothetical protein
MNYRCVKISAQIIFHLRWMKEFGYEELCGLYMSPDIVRIVKYGTLERDRHVDRMRGTKIIYRIF